jgi:glyoxylase-like metal-dependent hydrolase (beta-lactamase superfamily II)
MNSIAFFVEPLPFEVYAIKYATVTRTSAENYIGGDPHEADGTMDYFVWLIRNAERTVLIDTGFSEEKARKRARQLLRSPAAGLKLLGVDAAMIEEIIITHLHFDHVGNLELFPRARFHLQEREMAYATGRYMGHKFFSRAFEEDQVIEMVRNVYAGRVEFHDGDAELGPGLSVHHVGGHSKGLQFVRVWTRLGWLVLASDASHYYANMEKEQPFPILAEATSMFDGWSKLHHYASRPQYIIPGHDPLVMQRYQAPEPMLEGIVVRLDAEPIGT